MHACLLVIDGKYNNEYGMSAKSMKQMGIMRRRYREDSNKLRRDTAEDYWKIIDGKIRIRGTK